MLRTPSPPARTGRDALVHVESERLTFRMVPSKDLRRESNHAGLERGSIVRCAGSTALWGWPGHYVKDRRHREHVKAVACSPGSEVTLF